MKIRSSEPPSIKEIFLAVVDLSAEARDEYLREKLGDDEHLRQRVQRMVASETDEKLNPLDGAIAELGVMAGESSSPINLEDCPHIGPYKLLSHLGEGGMGEVFVAEQREPVERTVAIKLIKPGMGSKEVVARFEAERQALAMMDHPNIARILEAGQTTDGRPYFVMELVRGISIIQYCDQHQLSLHDRLKLFIDVCLAVHHAHQKGVIHRDLKPSNVLVELHDVRHVPKVIDFGLAKATHRRLTDRTLYTQFSRIIGTPLYMSPEQAELSGMDIDTRSDIYTLGVILYELTSGTTPFDREAFKAVGFDEMRRIIREDQPKRPSHRISTMNAAERTTLSERRPIASPRLEKKLETELDWIVMKSLEKDRSRRYESASAFAADIRRFLDDEPVEACPPSKTYQLKKLVRRHRTVVSFVSVVLMLAVIAAGLLWNERARTLAALDAEQEQLQRAELQRERAEANFARAREAVDTYFTQISKNELLNVPSLDPLRKELLGLALEYYQGFVKEHGDDPTLKADLADAYTRVARITSAVSSKEDSLSAFATALELWQELAEADQGNRIYQSKLAKAYRDLGSTKRETGNRDGVVELLTNAITISKQLVDDHATDEFKSELAHSYEHLGQHQQDLGDMESALHTYQTSIAIRKELVERHPANTKYQDALAVGVNNLGICLLKMGDREAAQNAFEQVADRWKAGIQLHPENRLYQVRLAGIYNNLAVLHGADRDRKSVRRFTQSAIKIVEPLKNQNPSVIEYQLLLAKLYGIRAGVVTLEGKGDSEGALELSVKSIEILRALATREPTVSEYQINLAANLRSYGELLIKANDLNSAMIVFQESVGVLKTLARENENVPAYRRSIALSYLKLGRLQLQLDDIAGALNSAQQSVDIGKNLAASEPEFVSTHVNLSAACVFAGEMYEKVGDTKAASNAYQSAIDVREALAAKFPESFDNQKALMRQYNLLGNHHKRSGESNAALRCYERVIQWGEECRRLQPESRHWPITALVAYVNSGALQMEIGDLEAALHSRQEALELETFWWQRNSTIPVARGNVAVRHLQLGEVQESLGKLDEALNSYRTAADTLAAIPNEDRTVTHWRHLAIAFYHLERWEDAHDAFEQGKVIQDEDTPTSLDGPRWWYLTMILARLGENEKALSYYQQLVREMEDRPPGYDVSDYRAEAAQLLGIEINATSSGE